MRSADHRFQRFVPARGIGRNASLLRPSGRRRHRRENRGSAYFLLLARKARAEGFKTRLRIQLGTLRGREPAGVQAIGSVKRYRRESRADGDSDKHCRICGREGGSYRQPADCRSTARAPGRNDDAGLAHDSRLFRSRADLRLLSRERLLVLGHLSLAAVSGRFDRPAFAEYLNVRSTADVRRPLPTASPRRTTDSRLVFWLAPQAAGLATGGGSVPLHLCG